MKFAILFLPPTEIPAIRAIASRASPKSMNGLLPKANSRSRKAFRSVHAREKLHGPIGTYAQRAMEGNMISERLQKSRTFIEAECVKTARTQNLCRELKHVRIRRLFPSGTAANWEPAEFEPPLSTVGECMAQKAISSLLDKYALAAGE
jgi:hypothetical protein